MMWEQIGAKASDRKLHLFRVACCCAIWEDLTENARTAVHAIELYADGGISRPELLAAYARVQQDYVAFHRQNPEACWEDDAWQEYGPVSLAKAVAIPSEQPYPLADEVWSVAHLAWGDRTSHRQRFADQHRPKVRKVLWCLFGNSFRSELVIEPKCVAWNSGAVSKLATAIYGDRAFERLSLLADALEDAGCTDAELLGHLRGPGPHVRGCWAVDLVLGKS
jgi:hypothetical protein